MMAAHGCIGNPCTICHPQLVSHKGSRFMEAGYVYAPYVPLVITPVIMGADLAFDGIDESLTKALSYPVPVLGQDGIKVGDLVKILLRKGQGPWDRLAIPEGELEAHACGIYLGSEEFTPRGAILNSRVCIRHVFIIGSHVSRIEEGSGWTIEVMKRVAEAE